MVSVAATSLLPVCHLMPRVLTREMTHVTRTLWDHTQHMDDITSSTHSIMALLAEILSHQMTRDTPSHDDTPSHNDTPADDQSPALSSLVPRLYPFLSHNSSQVMNKMANDYSHIPNALCSQPMTQPMTCERECSALHSTV